jgi:hypothetical protein
LIDEKSSQGWSSEVVAYQGNRSSLAVNGRLFATLFDAVSARTWGRPRHASEIDLTGVTPIHLHFNYENGQRRILAEVAGPNPVSPQNAALVQDRVINEIGSDTEINLWYRNEFVVNETAVSMVDN